ncbi:SRPBCC domain-containing protein [Jonesiaceae bacterium BS-20]|uniref:SRPBCC domain-containing protein n=1 Tax=Jonesiaceae bacterium BS-20 TaxID=3120821 RepID=A0AAU7DZL6_9MICO
MPTATDAVISAQVAIPLAATLNRDQAPWVLSLRRPMPHSPHTLWQMITEPEYLAHWSPIVPNRPLTTPGPATCRETPEDTATDAEVLSVGAYRQLIHQWGPEQLTWNIHPDHDGTVLELHQTVNSHTEAIMNAAGWHICLARLATEQGGVSRERVVGMRAMDYGFAGLVEHYEELFPEAN